MTGRLIAVVGPSGVGKDSVIRALSEAVPSLGRVRRVITRPPESEGEDHVPVPEAEFRRLAGSGAFLLHWEAHGLCYGIPVEVAEALTDERDMLVNLSRAVLREAAGKVARFEVIALAARRDVLAARLAGRGRESAAEIAERLSRAARPLPDDLRIHHIDNSGALSDTVTEILARLYPETVTS